MHARLRERGYSVNARKKQVEVSQEEPSKSIVKKYLNELRTIGYNIQLTIN